MTDIQAIPIAPARQIARLASPADFFAVYNKKKKLAFGAVGRAVEKPPTPQQSTSTSPPRASSPVHSTSTTKSKLSATAAPFIMPNASITSAVTNATVQETKAKVNASRSILVAGTTGTWPQYGVEYEDENMATINDEQQVELDFDDRVSEAGLEGLPRQHVRATEGNDVTNELLDWDGKRWAPVPASWEYDRAAFDGGFLPNYIREWVQTVPAGKRVTVNINNPLFANGKAPIDNDVLIFPTYQPITTPYSKSATDSDPVTKPESSEAAALTAQKHAKEKMVNKKLDEEYKKQRDAELASYVPGPNRFTPAIDMYLRPAETKDLIGIADIYNKFIASSIIPEDQAPVSPEDILGIMKAFKKKYPFIVAIRGSCPIVHSMHNPEQVLGFARAEPFEIGITGSNQGRSRYTANLHLYVDPQFQHKGVGSQLLDRLIHMLCPGYGYLEGSTWANPTRSKYNEAGGCGYFHQLIFKMPILSSDSIDPVLYDKFFFGKFFFKMTARLASVARTSCERGDAKFTDILFLQRDASISAEFNGCH